MQKKKAIFFQIKVRVDTFININKSSNVAQQSRQRGLETASLPDIKQEKELDFFLI